MQSIIMRVRKIEKKKDHTIFEKAMNRPPKCAPGQSFIFQSSYFELSWGAFN